MKDQGFHPNDPRKLISALMRLALAAKMFSNHSSRFKRPSTCKDFVRHLCQAYHNSPWTANFLWLYFRACGVPEIAHNIYQCPYSSLHWNPNSRWANDITIYFNKSSKDNTQKQQPRFFNLSSPPTLDKLTALRNHTNCQNEAPLSPRHAPGTHKPSSLRERSRSRSEKKVWQNRRSMFMQ